MSHVKDVRLRLLDLDAAEEAAGECGLVLKRGQRAHKWYGRWMNDYHGAEAAVDRGFDPATFGRCEHALVLKDARAGDYEIGLVKAKDGHGWDVIYDSWGDGGRRIERAAGQSLTRFKREYGIAVARRRLQKKLGTRGWRVTREEVSPKRTRLRVRRRR